MLGPGRGDKKEMRCLSRLRYDDAIAGSLAAKPSGMTQLCLRIGNRGSITPGVKEK